MLDTSENEPDVLFPFFIRLYPPLKGFTHKIYMVKKAEKW